MANALFKHAQHMALCNSIIYNTELYEKQVIKIDIDMVFAKFITKLKHVFFVQAIVLQSRFIGKYGTIYLPQKNCNKLKFQNDYISY